MSAIKSAIKQAMAVLETAAVALSICGCDEDADMSAKGVHLAGSSQSECLSNAKAGSAASSESATDSIAAFFRHDTLFVSHFHAEYNCCQKIVIDLEPGPSLLRFVEHPTGNMCRCVCRFDLGAQVAGLDPGVYTIQVWNEDQSVLFGQLELTVPLLRPARRSPGPDKPDAGGREWLCQAEQAGYQNRG